MKSHRKKYLRAHQLNVRYKAAGELALYLDILYLNFVSPDPILDLHAKYGINGIKLVPAQDNGVVR